MGVILKELVLRPNLQNQGTLPEFGEFLDKCPDILCSGNEPIADFRNTLAVEDRYSRDYNAECVRGYINYIYIRIKNNSSEELNDIFADLFYCDEDHVGIVSSWKRIPIENREPNSSGNPFNVIKANEIGVAEAPFMLPSNLKESEKYYLIARIWSDSEKYRNPMPEKSNPTSIENLLAEHLLWGQKKVNVNYNYEYPFSCNSINFLISAESGSNDTENEYFLSLDTSNVAGRNIKVEIRNSRTDDAGKKILFEKAIISSKKEKIGIFKLRKGYSSQMTLYIYRPEGQRPSIDEEYRLSVWIPQTVINNVEQSAEKIEDSQLLHISTFKFNI